MIAWPSASNAAFSFALLLVAGSLAWFWIGARRVRGTKTGTGQ